MPTRDPGKALSLEKAAAFLARKSFGPSRTPEDKRIGLETEMFPIFTGSSGSPLSRVPLAGPRGVVRLTREAGALVLPMKARHGLPPGYWTYDVDDGGWITFEPGAQVEYASHPLATARFALADNERAIRALRNAFRKRGVSLAAVGLDLWNEAGAMPLQLRTSRHAALKRFFDRAGPWGTVMMVHTSGFQINLDLGEGDVRYERWLLANLMAPLVTACFACSPKDDSVCRRAMIWQRIDPTRTGFPKGLMEERLEDLPAILVRAILDAHVALVKLDSANILLGDAGWSFRDWIEKGHESFGWPLEEDLAYHMTTLYFEVRTRGYLEIRSCDGLPLPWLGAPVVWTASLLYDRTARENALNLLLPRRRDLPELWRRAAAKGLGDPELHALSMTLWEEALRAAGRNTRYYGRHALETARRFFERFTANQRAPSDELRRIMDRGPQFALDWASGDDFGPSNHRG